MKIRRFRPYFLIVISFLIVITIGTILLALPIASSSGKSFGFVNSLFMATSSVCVTGLSVMNISVEMTIFGKVVMCFLMEIGGLSFITIAVFFFTIFGAGQPILISMISKSLSSSSSLFNTLFRSANLFIIASLTDFLDGYVARKYNMVTDFGKMVDAIISLKEYNRYSKGLFSFVGFDVKWIEYKNVQRVHWENNLSKD